MLRRGWHSRSGRAPVAGDSLAPRAGGACSHDTGRGLKRRGPGCSGNRRVLGNKVLQTRLWKLRFKQHCLTEIWTEPV